MSRSLEELKKKIKEEFEKWTTKLDKYLIRRIRKGQEKEQEID